MELSLASIFLIFTGTSIGCAFFAAAAMFGVTSLYGYMSSARRNFTSARSQTRT